MTYKDELHGCIAAGVALGLVAGGIACAHKSASTPAQFNVSRVILEEAVDTMMSSDESDLHQDAVYTLHKIKQVDATYTGSSLEHAKTNLIRIVYSEEADVNSSNESLKMFGRHVIADDLRYARTEAYEVENNRSGSWGLATVPLFLGAVVSSYIALNRLTGRGRRLRDLRDAGP